MSNNTNLNYFIFSGYLWRGEGKYNLRIVENFTDSFLSKFQLDRNSLSEKELV